MSKKYSYEIAILAMKLVLCFDDFKRYNSAEEIPQYERETETQFLVCECSAFTSEIGKYCLLTAEELIYLYREEKFISSESEYNWLSDKLWQALCIDGFIIDFNDEEE